MLIFGCRKCCQALYLRPDRLEKPPGSRQSDRLRRLKQVYDSLLHNILGDARVPTMARGIASNLLLRWSTASSRSRLTVSVIRD